MSGWLSDVMGRKRFYMTCAAIFIVPPLRDCAESASVNLFPHSARCGRRRKAAPPLRHILADTFSAAQRAIGFAMYGVAVVVAPAVGPNAGGMDHR